MTVLHWFRDDLRLLDNPALTHASQNGATAYIYIIEPGQLLGGAASVWLHHSLAALNYQLDGNLLLLLHSAAHLLLNLFKQVREWAF